ncbi:MAG: DMT family transporter [Fimbriimonadaceae bacterium]|nr:DMT family transporter [Chitinophagales bacterium]
MHGKAVQYILYSTFLFALMNVCIKLIPRIPSYEIVLFRSSVSFILSAFLLYRLNLNPFKKGNKLFLIIRGLSGSIALLLFFYTLQNLPLATAVTIQYLSPIFTVIFASFIVKEDMHWKQWIFFLLSFIGIILIKGFDPRVSVEMLMLGILAAACSGISYNAVRRAKDDEPAVVVVFYLPLITLPIVTPYCATHWIMPVGTEWFYLIAVGVITQFAQFYMTRAYQMEKASSIANYTYIGILFALLFGYFLFNERFDMLAITGMIIVVAGIILNYFYVNKVTSAKRFRAYMRNFPGI